MRQQREVELSTLLLGYSSCEQHCFGERNRSGGRLSERQKVQFGLTANTKAMILP